MRLIHFEGGSFDGVLRLAHFFGNDTPPYGILSHTWGPDNEEVTLEDVMGATGQHKLGFNKIRFLAIKANNNLQYCWIGTCCIDKSNNVEVNEAINSTFRWYAEAVVCYVYLSDVSKEGLVPHSAPWWKSKWFTRGWTLQELLAPRRVEFYAVDGTYFGDRRSQAVTIHRATGINGLALHGRALSKFSVQERLR